MAASHRAAATIVLMIVSLLMAVALSGADARPAVRLDKTAASLSGADDVRHTGGNTKLTVRLDRHGGYVAAAVAPDDKLVKTESEDEEENENAEYPIITIVNDGSDDTDDGSDGTDDGSDDTDDGGSADDDTGP